MKKVASLVFVLAIILVYTGVTSCAGEKGGLGWNNMPVYPGAELELTRTWSVLPEEEPLSEVEWRYYEVGDKYSVSEVASFYESEMPAKGWQKISGLETLGIWEILWGYCYKINLYVPPEIVGRLSSWAYYSKNNEKDWAAIWIGINKQWEEADKTCILIMMAR